MDVGTAEVFLDEVLGYEHVIRLVQKCPFCDAQFSCSQNTCGDSYTKDGFDCCKSCATRRRIS